jgi:hypothetical protein
MRCGYVVPMRWMVIYGYGVTGGALTLSLLKPRYLIQPFNVIKWQLAFNSAG